jgi:hypothetical protein
MFSSSDDLMARRSKVVNYDYLTRFLFRVVGDKAGDIVVVVSSCKRHHLANGIMFVDLKRPLKSASVTKCQGLRLTKFGSLAT